MTFQAQVWSTLSTIDVGQHIEKKGNLSYLSWAWAWSTLMSHYPASTYIVQADEHLPDGSVMTNVAVTVSDGENAVSRDMWLPVMDNRNNAIIGPTSRQISDTRMRCLVKAIAMHGLGFYIYAGEDLPSEKMANETQLARLRAFDLDAKQLAWLERGGITYEQAAKAIKKLEEAENE